MSASPPRRTTSDQIRLPYTGEGAYQGSTKPAISQTIPLAAPQVFDALPLHFPNRADIVASLPPPNQNDIQSDGATFVWAHWDTAIQQAGPLTRTVLDAMSPFLKHDKKYIYVDSKIQYFQLGDLPVDSDLWHIDGTFTLKGEAAAAKGYYLLHDLHAKNKLNIQDNYLAYQSSQHCATEWLAQPLTLILPAFIPNFQTLDKAVQASQPQSFAQPAASIISCTDQSLHRAVPATAEGWRLWIRVLETDKEIVINPKIIACYNTVYATTT